MHSLRSYEADKKLLDVIRLNLILLLICDII